MEPRLIFCPTQCLHNGPDQGCTSTTEIHKRGIVQNHRNTDRHQLSHVPDLYNRPRRQVLTISCLKNQGPIRDLTPEPGTLSCFRAPADARQGPHWAGCTQGLAGCLPSIPDSPGLHHRTSGHHWHLAPSLAHLAPSARNPASQRSLSSSSSKVPLSGLTPWGIICRFLPFRPLLLLSQLHICGL